MYNRDQPYRHDGGKNVNVTDLYNMEKSLRTDNSYAQWLTNGEWNNEKFNQYMFLRSLPVIGSYTDFLTSYYDDMSYMKNQGLTWDDVKRPWKLSSSNAGATFIRSGYNFVSSNVKRLYR